MALVFETFYAEGLAQLSYLVGDDSAGVAAVIDPRRDVQVYLSRAAERGVRIAHVVESHIHADFVSGSHELCARTGAALWGGVSDDYGFVLNPAKDGERLALGSASLGFLHTPGHTPEHVSLLLRDENQGAGPVAVFTGDTLFNLDVGRPDLMGGGSERRLAAALHHSLFDTLLPLGDRVEVYPCHGAGSSCGKSIGDRRQTTIGNERRFNPALQPRGVDAFTDWLLDGMPEPPRHYARLKAVNAAGAPVRGDVPVVPPVSPQAFQAMAADGGALIVDTRSMLAFGGGHVPGALNIGMGPQFATWVGWMIPPDSRVLLVADGPAELAEAALQLFRVGYDNVAGYLHGGMAEWQNAGLPFERVSQWTARELSERVHLPGVVALDVRTDAEFEQGHVPGARHVFLPHLDETLSRLDRDTTIAAYCGTGYRASIAASVLARNGFGRVANVPGSWQAWQANGLPVEDGGGQQTR